MYVFCDWKDETNKDYVDISESDFDRMWENDTEKIRVIPFPSVVLQKLAKFRKDSVDYQTDEKQFSYDEFVKPAERFRIPEDVVLREVQKETVSNWLAADHRGIFSMCTGAGKSYTALACMVALAKQTQEHLAVFIICPQIHLVGQWEEERFTGGHCRSSHIRSPETGTGKKIW